MSADAGIMPEVDDIEIESVNVDEILADELEKIRQERAIKAGLQGWLSGEEIGHSHKVNRLKKALCQLRETLRFATRQSGDLALRVAASATTTTLFGSALILVDRGVSEPMSVSVGIYPTLGNDVWVVRLLVQYGLQAAHHEMLEDDLRDPPEALLEELERLCDVEALVRHIVRITE